MTASRHERRFGAARLTAFILIAAVAFASPGLGMAASDESPSVVPYRPSVSTPAALSAPGWLEIEAGVLHVHDRVEAPRSSVSYTLKLAFTEDWGMRLGGDAWTQLTDDAGRRIAGAGDIAIVLKRRIAVDDNSAFGIEVGATAPIGKAGISNGKSDHSLNGIYSADIGSYHADLNLVATRLGAAPPDVGRTQTLWAAALSRSLGERWGLVGELSGTHQRGTQGTSQFLFATSYNVSRSMTIDAGMARSLRSGASWSAFTGFTLLGPRIF